MENRYNKEIAELLSKIDLLAYRIGTKTEHDVIVRYSTYTNLLEVDICRFGWNFDLRKEKENICIELDKATAIEELQKVIKILEELEKEEA